MGTCNTTCLHWRNNDLLCKISECDYHMQSFLSGGAKVERKESEE